MKAVKGALDEQVVEHALQVALEELKRRMEAAQPTQLEADLRRLDMRIERALDLAIELGYAAVAKQKLRAERERLAADLAGVRIDLPTVEELMPRLREKLRDLQATLN
jgi:hypothetical protein